MEPKEQIKAIEEKALADLNNVKDLEGLTNFRNTYLAKKSELSSLMGKMKEIPAEERGAFGKAVNDARANIENAFNEKKAAIEKAALDEKLKSERIDLTLPGRTHTPGKMNPCWVIIDEMCDIFASMGFDIVEGRDVETDHFNFELLNVPKDHPARDMQDTFY
nr:phenylalanine--tRNA ligase subunit alpha [Bacilli bacterium]